MALYTIADLHLSEGCDKPMDIFGPAWENHSSRLEKAWRALVGEDDTVVVPGDISWAMRLDEAVKDFMFINSLPGRKIIGKGNHDYWWNTLKKLDAFIKSIGADTISFLFNNAYKADNKVICGTRGWFPENVYSEDDEKIALREAGRLRLSLEQGRKLAENGEEIIVFLHYPPYFGGIKCAPVAELLREYNIKRCYYGHLHGAPEHLLESSIYKTELHLISADRLEFTPLLIK